MKKLLPKLALALLPVALYLCVFIAFEPNNYFGLKSTADGSTPLARVRAYEAAPTNAVILGDSRMAHFDMSAVQAASGQAFTNVAYGGAGLEESIDEFYYLAEKYPQIDTVVFGVSFYTLNAAYRPVNRMKTVEMQLQDPAAYILNLEYNINMLTNLANTLHGTTDADNEETAEHFPAQYNITAADGSTLRGDLAAYAASLYANCATGITAPAATIDGKTAAEGVVTNAQDIYDALQSATPANSKFAINEEAAQKLQELCSYCAEHGIKLWLVFPPMDETVRTLVCAPLGISDEMQSYVSALTEQCAQLDGVRVLDYEWTDAPAYDDTMFYDGFHLDTVHGLPVWTQQLFGTIGEVA